MLRGFQNDKPGTPVSAGLRETRKGGISRRASAERQLFGVVAPWEVCVVGLGECKQVCAIQQGVTFLINFLIENACCVLHAVRV